MKKKIEIRIVNKSFSEEYIPKYATYGSSGLDLYACIKRKINLKANSSLLIPTGIAINIKDRNISGMILPRSGIGHHRGIILGNSVGLIDSDYQGEIFVSLWNRSMVDFLILPKDRIAQIVFFPTIRVEFELVKNFKVKSSRNTQGFGHSGIRN
ncbi:dUTP diphosphatase [bacterium endosymbiont of Pedicinus badii]|uniref:dUTP diphosphatase n=1 Tax=bacterium endosymbiont of Pedicinus badii TaxID=1719126 RepID=UPI0009B9AE06|nr:dUTP diphosphatase [bacterium endosymbiont of Pedicinus badii]OQM34063.1 deoxyuridine 5'-triphosphate nucleotidohydrolase [bacterium endosymbiont of Pedicinus badii]